jgi:TM2 domain-containing membrane protein YozV
VFEALRLDAGAVKAEEEAIRLRVRELDDESRKYYHTRFRERMKDPDTYAMLNYFFLTGFHHMYLGYFVRGTINLFVLMLGIAFMFFGNYLIGGLLIFLILVSELMALFRSQTVVADYNNKIATEILDELAED